MRFTKMHGLGNDYVYVDARTERIENPPDVARLISDRHTGVGSDGLIIIHPSTVADVRMEMYNADGSRGRMCGNGIRCVAKYAVEHGLTPGPAVRVETDSGIKECECFGASPAPGHSERSEESRTEGWPRFSSTEPGAMISQGKGEAPAEPRTAVRATPNPSHLLEKGRGEGGAVVHRVRVNMGAPSLRPADLPSTIKASRIVNCPIQLDGEMHEVTCVSMGNPHAVIFVDKLHLVDLVSIGPQIENAPEFPERINAHFVRVDSPTRMTIRTWERGSGATRACGTGACAVCVAGVVTGRTDRAITAALPGGELEIEWAADGNVYMTGEAVEVFSGEWSSR